MKWAWEQDYRDRPSSSQLESVLTTSAVPHLVDAYSLQGRCHPKVHYKYYNCTYYIIQDMIY